MIRKIIIASDLHGPEQCRETVQALFSFTDKFQPDRRLFLGDLFDFTPLMSKASQREKEESIEEDVRIGIEFLDRWKPHVFLFGNHDLRLLEIYHKPGNEMLKDLFREYIRRIDEACERNGTIIVQHDKTKCYELGGVCYIHGFAATKHTAAKHSQHYSSSVVSGHVHRFSASPSERADQKGLSWTIGCLCKESLSYDKKMLGTISHESGFAYGIFDDKAGWTELYPVRRSTGYRTILDVV